jgi:outer membrane receptor protein involved in Fe transport
MQPTLNFKSRFFASPGFRLDGGSASGTHAGLTGFPKIDFSYLAVDQDHPMGILTLFRPRLALGYAGTQPSPTAKLRIFNLRTDGSAGDTPLGSLDGGTTQVPFVTLSTLGNTHLRPERTSEVEGGVDANFGNDRLQLALTFYDKTRHDAIISVPVPPSVVGRGAAGTQIFKNIGVVRNAGTEITVSARLLDGRAISWTTTANVTRDENKVVRLNPGESTIIVGSSRIEAGYPLWGTWARPIVSYVDANQNGIIDYNEIRLGDSAVFVGQNEPNYQLNASNTIALWQGRFSVTANLSYQNGLTQTQGQAGANNRTLYNLPNTPGTSLGTQAAIVASTLNQSGQYNLSSGGVSPIGVIQTVNTLRFTSLSINYIPPASVLRFFHVPVMSVALQGSNLGLHTNYRGADPNVNAFSTANWGDILQDTGQLPEPRTWSLSIRLGN